MDYFVSDLHFGCDFMVGEKGISRGESRGEKYSTVEEMDAEIINTINEVVSKDDNLFIVGDVACYSKAHHAVDCLKKLYCENLYLIIGNHDMEPLNHRSFRACFKDIKHTMTYRGEKYHVFLSHYPMAEWDGYFKGNWCFYGHVHNNKTVGAALADFMPTAVNIGLDVIGKPKTAEELIRDRQETYVVPDMEQLIEFRRRLFTKSADRGTRTLSFEGFKNIKK